jgi:hypothetical protein
MKRTTAETINLILCAASLVFVLFALSACTVVRYKDTDKTLLIADLRISGSAIDLSATMPAVGTLVVNREQGSAAAAVAEAAAVIAP